jgi:hypothetical protein
MKACINYSDAVHCVRVPPATAVAALPSVHNHLLAILCMLGIAYGCSRMQCPRCREYEWMIVHTWQSCRMPSRTVSQLGSTQGTETPTKLRFSALLALATLGAPIPCCQAENAAACCCTLHPRYQLDTETYYWYVLVPSRSIKWSVQQEVSQHSACQQGTEPQLEQCFLPRHSMVHDVWHQLYVSFH